MNKLTNDDMVLLATDPKHWPEHSDEQLASLIAYVSGPALAHYDETVPVSDRVDYSEGDSISMRAEDFNRE